MANWLRVNFGAELFDALKASIDEKKLKDWPQALESLAGYLANGPAGPEQEAIEEALDAAGLEDQLEKVRSFWQELSPSTQALLKPVEQVPGELSWPLWDGGTGPETGWKGLPVSFDVSAEASAALEPVDGLRAKTLDVALEQGDYLLRAGHVPWE